MGKIASSLIEEGVKLGVSSRGIGSLKPTREGINVVGDDFMLATAADIVADPSAPDAFVEENGRRIGYGRRCSSWEVCWKNMKQQYFGWQKALDEKNSLFNDFLSNL